MMRERVRMEDDPRHQHLHRPHIGMCSLGKTRWYWVAARSWFAWMDAPYDDKDASLLASGYAPDKVCAEHAARAVAGEDALTLPAGMVLHFHREGAKQRRLEAAARSPKSRAGGTAAMEFVYVLDTSPPDSYYPGDPPWTPTWGRHQLIKRTKARVYIDARWYVEGWARPVERTIALDRATLERDGSVWHRGARKRFYLKPEERGERRYGGFVAPCLAMLGLEYPCTPDEVERAYRLKARENHPDTGGDHDAFLALRDAYEAALRLVRVAA